MSSSSITFHLLFWPLYLGSHLAVSEYECPVTPGYDMRPTPHLTFYPMKSCYKPGEIVTITCEVGYTLTSKDDRYHCEPVKCPPITRDNAMSSCSDKLTDHNETCTLQCEEGFYPPEKTTVRCDDNRKSNIGTWNGTIPECQRICNNTYIAHGSLHPTNHTFKYRDNVTVQCFPDYVLINSDKPICDSNGTFTGLGQCVPTKCSGSGDLKTIYPKKRNSEELISKEGLQVYCYGDSYFMMTRRYWEGFPFSKTYEEYVNGFGEIQIGYWMGLENMHLFTSNGDCDLSFDMWNSTHTFRMYAIYSNFKVSSKETNYTLNIGGYDTIRGFSPLDDAFNPKDLPNKVSNGQPFSTYDRIMVPGISKYIEENDNGGWWYNSGGAALALTSSREDMYWLGYEIGTYTVWLSCR